MDNQSRNGFRPEAGAADGDGNRLSLSGGFNADGKRRHGMLLFGFGDHGVEMAEYLGNAHGIHFAAGVVALLDQLFQVSAGNLGGKLIGDDFAGAFFLLDPGGAGQGDPHGAAIDVKAHVDGVGVAGGDGDNIGLPAAVEVFSAPALDDVKIFVHKLSVIWLRGQGQGRWTVQLTR